MNFYFPKRNRKLNRLKNWDYSSYGYYAVTICIKNRIEYFGNIQNNKMNLNQYGEITKHCWYDLPNHYWNCKLDKFTIVPNHVHGIILIDNDSVGNGFKPFPTKRYSLSEMIRGFKTFSSRRINQFQNQFLFQWQKSFYDRIIRDDQELYRQRNYIINNPANWKNDRNNPLNFRKNLKKQKIALSRFRAE